MSDARAPKTEAPRPQPQESQSTAGASRCAPGADQPSESPTRTRKSDGCRGCYNDVYNHGLGGARACWHLATAQNVVNVEVHIDKPPPYLSEKPAERFKCYRRQRFAYLSVEYVERINRECGREVPRG